MNEPRMWISDLPEFQKVTQINQARPVEPDMDMVRQFFNALYPRVCGGCVNFRAIPERDKGEKPQNFHYVLDHKFFENVEGFVRRCAETGKAAFIVPATMTPGGTGKSDVLSMPGILADFDSGDPAQSLRAAEALLGPATIVLESGGVTDDQKLPRIHAHWRLSQPATGSDIERVCRVRELLAERFSGDKSFKQPAQPIRIGGSLHQKTGTKLVRIRTVRDDAEYALEDICRAAGLAKAPTSNILPFNMDFSRDASAVSVERVLTQPIHAGAVDDITRYEGAGKALGHIIRQLREGRFTSDQAWEAVCEWNAAVMRPSWDEQRLRNDWERLLRLDIEKRGPLEAPQTMGTVGRAFKLDDWSMRRYSGAAPPQRWLVDHVFPLGDAGILAGDGGIGKSFLALDLCYRVAALKPPGSEVMDFGRPELFGGMILEAGSAVFVTAEESQAALHRRLEALDPDGRRSGLVDRLFAVSLREQGGAGSLIGSKSKGYPMTDYARELLAELKTKPDLRLVVLDPLAVFFGAEANDRTAAQAFANVLNHMATETGATVIVLHHMRKDSEASASRKNVLGSGGFVDAFRFTYTLAKIQRKEQAKFAADYSLPADHGELVLGELVKSNGSREGGDHLYERQANGVLRQLGRRIDIAMAEHERRRVALVDAVHWYAEWGQPFTKTSREGGSGLHHNRHALPEPLRALTQRQLEALAAEAVEKGELQVAAAGKEKTQKWLCKPMSSVAQGLLRDFTPGARPAWEAREGCVQEAA